MKRIISFLKTDVKLINSYFLFTIVLIILVCIGYSSYALFSFTKTSTNIIEGTVGKLKKPDLISLEITNNPTKTIYAVGENFDSSGMVILANYSNNKTKVITDYSITDGNNLSLSKNSVTISYTENEITKSVTTNIVVASKTLNENSWDVISKVASAGKGKEFWSVGDTKNVILNGNVGDYLTLENLSIDVFIIGFDHNASVEGDNRIHFQFGKMNGETVAIVDKRHGSFVSDTTKISFVVELKTTDSFTWLTSNIRNAVLGADVDSPLSPKENTFLSVLPLELREVLRPCPKYTNNVYNSMSSNMTLTPEIIFLLSQYEYYGTNSDQTTEDEKNYQKQYEYYANGGSQAKKRHNRITATARDWTRSVVKGWRGWTHVNRDGTSYYEAPNADFGIAPAFVVGK